MKSSQGWKCSILLGGLLPWTALQAELPPQIAPREVVLGTQSGSNELVVLPGDAFLQSGESIHMNCWDEPIAPCCPPLNDFCCTNDWLEFRADYLYWATTGEDLPPLVTTSPTNTPLNVGDGNGTLVPVAGALGSPGVQTLFGGSEFHDDGRSGLYLSGAIRISKCSDCWLEISGFGLEDQGETFVATSQGEPTLFRPFFDANLNLPNAQLVAFPNIVTGSVTVDTAMDDFYGASGNLRKRLCCVPSCGCREGGYKVYLLGGYRFLNFDNSLGITENLTTTANNRNTPAGTNIIVRDRFETENEFHGGQIGLMGEWQRGNLVLRARGLIGFGVSVLEGRVAGSTTFTLPDGTTTTSQGGLLAQNSNIGSDSTTDFAVVPELGVSIGYRITRNITASVGYNFLYWSNVVRAGDQVDLVVDTNQLPPLLAPGTRPERRLNDTDFWAQGLNAGVQVRF